MEEEVLAPFILPRNIRKELKLSDRIYNCKVCSITLDRTLNAAINIHNAGLIAVGMSTPKITSVEIGALPAMGTPINETGSSLLAGWRMSQKHFIGSEYFN